MSNFYYYNYDELYHHGIKGQKWGVRRFQNKDGTLTPAGKKRYNEDVENAKVNVKKATETYRTAKKAYDKASIYEVMTNKQIGEQLTEATRNLRYAKEDLSDAKLKVKYDNQTKKSKRQLSFEKKYMDEGMPAEEAALAAYKRVRTEKIVAATAAVAVTAVASYAAYKHWDKTIDKLIDPGTTIQNISTNSNKGVAQAFYGSMTKGDNTKYRGLYGATLRDVNTPVYETQIGVKSGLKLASQKSATGVLSDLVKSDKQYAEDLTEQITRLSNGMLHTPKQQKLFNRAVSSLKSGKVDNNVYEALNIALVDHSTDKANSVSQRFYDALKSKGYDAIKDINDAKYSGYNSRNPIIVFNAASKASVDRIRELGEAEISKNQAKAMTSLITTNMVKSGSKYAAGYAGLAAVINTAASRSDASKVKQYRQEHPNSTMTSREILRMLEKENK